MEDDSPLYYKSAEPTPKGLSPKVYYTKTTEKYIPTEKDVKNIHSLTGNLSKNTYLIIKFFPWNQLESGQNGVVVELPIQ
jgi:hypothetical protein